MEWIFDPTAWTGLATLVVLEIVLGIDNLIFIAILADKLPPHQRQKARLVGLSLALLMRLFLLAGISKLVGLTESLFTVLGHGVSARDLIMLVGGAFLLFKATVELHEKLEGGHAHKDSGAAYPRMWQVIVQIVVLDAVFSLDAVITAVGMVDHVEVMMIAVLIAITLMMVASKMLMDFVSAHPTVVILCLGFLMMIGFSLVVEGLGYHIPKGYLYAAIGFSVLIEAFNQLAMRNRRKVYSMGDMRTRTANAVLSMLGGRPLDGGQAPVGDEAGAGVVTFTAKDDVFDPQERLMIQRVLQLAEQSVQSIMTPRHQVYWIDLADDEEMLRREIKECPYSSMVVARDAQIEEPLGIIQKKDLAGALLNDGKVDYASLVIQPIFLPDSVTVLQALDSFRQTRIHTAFVVDEYGTLEGFVTLTDVVEAIAGDMPEAHEQDDFRSERQSDGSYLFNGMVPIQELMEVIGQVELPEGDYHTAAGLVLGELKRLPKKGDVVEIENWRIKVLEMEKRRIKRLQFIPSKAAQDFEV